MFERDKTELRELGVPLETGRNSGFDTADGYRIARHDYELGEIDLEPDEAAAVALAARLWDTPGLAGAAHGAVLKLRAAGVEVDETGSGPVQPRVRAVEPAFGPAAGGRAGRSGGDVPAPPRRPDRRGQPADGGAVGGGVGAGPLVPGGPRPRPGGRPLVPALPDRGAGDDARRRRGPCRCRPGWTCSRWSTAASRLPPVIGTARLWVAAGRAHGLRRLGRPAPAAPARDRGRRRAGDRPAQPGHGRPVGRRLRAGRRRAAPAGARGRGPPGLGEGRRRAPDPAQPDPPAGSAALAPAGRRRPG